MFVRKNGEEGFGDLTMVQIKIGEKDCVLSLLRDVTSKVIAEQEIQEYQKNLRYLTSELTIAEEKERRRIAVNLHDHLGQSLAMSKIKLAEAQKENDPVIILDKVDAAKKYLDDSITNSRIITYELSPPVLHELGFSAAIRWRLGQIEDEHNIKTEIIDNSMSIALKDDVRIILFRAFMEIANNAIKHSFATKITTEIKNDNNFLYVIVSDNGISFDPITAEKEATNKKSFGLFSIRERISFLNGQMKIISKIGKGTTISIKIPNESISDERG